MSLQKNWPRVAFGLGLVAAAALAAFLVGRYALADESGAEAQLQAGSENFQRAVEDRAKPVFVGELNGIVFYTPEGSYRPTPPPGCEQSEGKRSLRGAEAEAAAKDSALDYTPGYLPPGVGKAEEGVLICAGRVVTISRHYASQGGPQISISRSLGRPGEFTAEAPADRLSAATIGGRRAVVMKPMFPGHAANVYMEDETGQWIVSGFNTSLDVVIRVAEEVR